MPKKAIDVLQAKATQEQRAMPESHDKVGHFELHREELPPGWVRLAPLIEALMAAYERERPVLSKPAEFVERWASESDDWRAGLLPGPLLTAAQAEAILTWGRCQSMRSPQMRQERDDGIAVLRALAEGPRKDPAQGGA